MGSDPEGLVSHSESKGMVVQASSPLVNKEKELFRGNELSDITRQHQKTIAEVDLNG